jgi:proteic killer suppression protein
VLTVIRRFRHRGLRRLYEGDDRREVNPEHADKITRVLARLDEATRPEQLDLPVFRLHPLRGDLAGYWSITVRANWRIIFRFEQGDVTDVDLVDYH